MDTSEPTILLAKYPDRSAGQAGGIPKYRRLALLDTYVLWLAKAGRPPCLVGEQVLKLDRVPFDFTNPNVKL